MFLILPLWIIAALVFAYHRSFWCDEMVRFNQSLLHLSEGFKILYGEPAPVAPGELILYRIFKLGFTSFLPAEIWGRIPGILWGAGTLWLALLLAKKDIRFRFLPWLMVFSVSLLMVSVQMRPYGSLMFAGALATLLILDTSKFTSILYWPTVFLTHIYGVCFISMAILKKKKWMAAVIGFTFVAIVLLQYHHLVSNNGEGHSLPPAVDILRQILGTLSNPLKSMLIMTPLFMFGFWTEAKTNRSLALWFFLLFAASIIAPVMATARSGYFFVPRQILGALFPFLALAALGFSELQNWLEEKSKNRKISFVLVSLLCAFTTVVPWIATVVLKNHSFPDQPSHRFREIAQSLIGSDHKTALLINPCNLASMSYYLTLQLGSPPLPQPDSQSEGILVGKSCWTSGPCIYYAKDMRYCWSDPHEVEAGHALWKLINSDSVPFDFVIHDFSILTVNKPGRASIRTW